jgi:restriction endonuclease S subunit
MLSLANGSNQKNLSKDSLINYKIPFPSDMTKFEPILDKLMLCHKTKSELESSIPQKEKVICDLIKKLTDEGEEGVDYDSHKFDDCIEYIPKKINIKKNEASFIGKYKFYTNGEYKDLYVNTCMFEKKYIIMGFVGNISIYIDKDFSVMDREVYVINSKKSTNDYMYYYIKSNLKNLKNKTHKSTISRITKDIMKNMQIKVIKPQIMKKHKIQELFDEVDKMREDIETNKLDYEKLSNEFMLMIDPNYKKDESNNELADEQPTDEPLDEVKEVKKIKKVVVKKNNINKLDESIDDLVDKSVIEPIKKL